MKIEMKLPKTIYYEDLKPGDCFTRGGTLKQYTYIKTDRENLAVCLENGIVIPIGKGDIVYPLPNAKVVDGGNDNAEKA